MLKLFLFLAITATAKAQDISAFQNDKCILPCINEVDKFRECSKSAETFYNQNKGKINSDSNLQERAENEYFCMAKSLFPMTSNIDEQQLIKLANLGYEFEQEIGADTTLSIFYLNIYKPILTGKTSSPKKLKEVLRNAVKQLSPKVSIALKNYECADTYGVDLREGAPSDCK